MAKVTNKVKSFFRFFPKGEKCLVACVIVYIIQRQTEYMMRVSVGKDVALTAAFLTNSG